MKNQPLEDDVNKLLDKHGLNKAVIIFPSDTGELSVLGLNTSEDNLRQIAHAIVNNLKDTRKLN